MFDWLYAIVTMKSCTFWRYILTISLHHLASTSSYNATQLCHNLETAVYERAHYVLPSSVTVFVSPCYNLTVHAAVHHASFHELANGFLLGDSMSWLMEHADIPCNATIDAAIQKQGTEKLRIRYSRKNCN